MSERIGEPDDPAGLASELRALVGTLKRRLREQADVDDFTGSQLSALRRLERDGPAGVTELARAEGVRPQSMGATVAALQAAGLVVGEPHPDDGRRTILSLTPACRAWIESGRAARQDWLTRTIQARLSTEQQAELARGLALLRLVAAP